jgi:DNA-binding CsgD family transcriptional regulator
MGKAISHPEGLLIQMEPVELARLAAIAEQVGLNGMTDDSVGAVLGRPVRIALLDGSLLERQFGVLLFCLAPGWEFVAFTDNLVELQVNVTSGIIPRPDLVIADPTGLCKQCPVSCLGDLHNCPLLSHREVIQTLPPVLLHLRKSDMGLACRAMSAGVKGLQLHRRGLMGLRDAVLAVLSQRERQVLLALEGGARVADVAESLVLSVNTVKTHLRRIYEKLGVDNRQDALLRARITGQLE